VGPQSSVVPITTGCFCGRSASPYSDYVEKIEAPPTNDYVPLLGLMNWLVNEVEQLLDELNAAGC
jgi:hypothetical protein